MSLPHTEYALPAYYIIAPAEARANLARFDGIRYGYRAAGADDLIEMYERTRGEGFGPEVKRRIMIGTYALSSGYYDAYYGQAQRVRTLIMEDFDNGVRDVDVIASPTSPTVAFRLGARTEDPLSMYLSDVCTIPVNLAGLPSLFDPVRALRRSAGGLPAHRARVLGEPSSEAAHALETAIGFQTAPAFRDSSSSGGRRHCGLPDGAPSGGREASMAEWEPVIGLEIHVELQTRTKMFCGCALSFGDPPNTHTCPVCLAHPARCRWSTGAPSGSPRASRWPSAAACGRATSSTARTTSIPTCPRRTRSASTTSRWPRRRFEYWDGDEKRTCRINRVHMEEDAAKLVHLGDDGRIAGSEYSVVDFNRGGTPLVEIVTEPDIHTPAAAASSSTSCVPLVIELGRQRLQHGGGPGALGRQHQRAPGRQLASSVRDRAQEHEQLPLPAAGAGAEIPRQIAILEAGGRIDQETLHFDPDTGTTSPLRSKEEAHDYRYFPEPDLVPLVMDPAWVEEVRAALPELPAARVERFMRQYALSRYDAFVLGDAGALARFYEEVVAAGADPKAAANWTMGEYLAYANEAGIEAGQGFVTPARLAALVSSSRTAPSRAAPPRTSSGS